MNKYLSDKLTAISFILIVMVVFLHSYNLEVKFNSGTELIKKGYNSFIQDLLSQGLTRIAVPLFFIISGYLFFLNIKNGSLSEFISKFRKRIETLVLPYFLWSIFGILFYLALQSVPFSKAFFTKDLIAEYSVIQLLRSVFIEPIPYQLWFIRDLIILIILSPLLYRLIKYIKINVIIIFFFTWIMDFSYVIFSNESLLFFTVGAYFTIQKINIQRSMPDRRYMIFIVTWLALTIAKTTLSYNNFENEWVIRIIDKLSIIIGMVAVWLAYDIILKSRDISKTKIHLLFQFTFFLYAFHEPILTIFKKAFYFILGQSELSSLVIYISAPIITIIASLSIGYLGKKHFTRFYYLMTGGR